MSPDQGRIPLSRPGDLDSCIHERAIMSAHAEAALLLRWLFVALLPRADNFKLLGSSHQGRCSYFRPRAKDADNGQQAWLVYAVSLLATREGA
jgi:hypothetical protein